MVGRKVGRRSVGEGEARGSGPRDGVQRGGKGRGEGDRWVVGGRE